MANDNPTNANTDYTVKQTVTTTAHNDNGKVDFTTDTNRDVTGELDPDIYRLVNGMVEKRVDNAVSAAMAEREARENVRANHRNLNRLLTLACAILIGIVVTYFFQNDGFPIFGFHQALPKALATTLYGYSFVITVLLDASLALYSFIRHY